MRIEVYKTRTVFFQREWRWRAVHRNGNIMAVGGEGYHNLADCRSAIDRVKRELPQSPLIVGFD